MKEMSRVGDDSPVHSVLKFLTASQKSILWRKIAIRVLMLVSMSTLNLHIFKADNLWWVVCTFFFKKKSDFPDALACQDFTYCFSVESNCLLIPSGLFSLQANRTFQELQCSVRSRSHEWHEAVGERKHKDAIYQHTCSWH